MATTRTTLAQAITTAISEDIIEPIGYNVPMHEFADVWDLPIKGDVLKVLRGTEPSEATALSKDSVYTLSNTTGQKELTDAYDQYTVLEYGQFIEVNKWAGFTTALRLKQYIANKLLQGAAMTMNSLSYDALIDAGLQVMCTHGLTATNAVEKAGSCNSATGAATTGCRSDLTEIDDYWNYGWITFYSGENRGLTRQVTDFTNTNGVIVCDAFPQAIANGDKFYITCVGNATASGPTDLAATDTLTLKSLYRARERCLRHGAGGLGLEGSQKNVIGITRKRDGAIGQGACFLPTRLMNDLLDTLSGNATAQDGNYFNTSEGFRRAVGGTINTVGGLMCIPINYYKQMSTTDGSVAVGTGTAHPAIVLFKNAFGCTVLKDKPGNRQGMSVQVKMPEKTDSAYMFDSLLARGEMDIINVYFCPNALHGVALMAGTSLI